jgi:hypothetical protein
LQIYPEEPSGISLAGRPQMPVIRRLKFGVTAKGIKEGIRLITFGAFIDFTSRNLEPNEPRHANLRLSSALTLPDVYTSLTADNV